jgi:DNA-binding NtrC family response regulator
MMSGHATIDTAVEATRIGAMNFLEKPIALQKLLKAVQQGLTRGQETARASAIPLRPVLLPAEEQRGMHASPSAPTASTVAHVTNRPAMQALHQDTHSFNLSFDLPLREARDAFERLYFEHHLRREGGSMTRVAEKTGLERTHLYRKLKQLGVESNKLAKKGE